MSNPNVAGRSGHQNSPSDTEAKKNETSHSMGGLSEHYRSLVQRLMSIGAHHLSDTRIGHACSNVLTQSVQKQVNGVEISDLTGILTEEINRFKLENRGGRQETFILRFTTIPRSKNPKITIPLIGADTADIVEIWIHPSSIAVKEFNANDNLPCSKDQVIGYGLALSLKEKFKGQNFSLQIDTSGGSMHPFADPRIAQYISCYCDSHEISYVHKGGHWYISGTVKNQKQ